MREKMSTGRKRVMIEGSTSWYLGLGKEIIHQEGLIKFVAKLLNFVKNRFILSILGSYNSLIDFLFALRLRSSKKLSSDLKEFDEVFKKALKRTDISDYLITLFVESLEIKPKLIVELGVRGGESTFVLERVAKLCNAKLVSVDIEDCSNVSTYENRNFIKKDDVSFAKDFKNWCEEKSIKPEIDVLFIDTSHFFEHTVQEVNHWFPYLSNRSKVFFHDTNLSKFFFRKDHSIGWGWRKGWSNERGVIRVLEDLFDEKFNEKREFIHVKDDWIIKHYPYCNGFTILVRCKYNIGWGFLKNV